MGETTTYGGNENRDDDDDGDDREREWLLMASRERGCGRGIRVIDKGSVVAGWI